MSRLILVSNRLPVTVKQTGERLEVTRSMGGLATGLKGPHEESGGLWVGWPGDVSKLSDSQRHELSQRLADLHVSPVFLTRAEVEGFYEGFSNRVLWPLFHYLVDHIPLERLEWDVYRAVNQRFADEVAKLYQEGDRIWVHDYQLMLVPGMLRQLLPDARIGFFLHIPFPSSEVLQALPWRNELLEGLLGADLIGFHTFPYVRHFSNSLLRLLGVPAEMDRVRCRGREVRFGAFPMGIDARSFSADAARPEVEAEVKRLREDSDGQRLLLGVDRLDYTKGIRRRLLALERLLTREPSLRGKLKLVQIAVPSRTSVDEYAEFRQDVDEVVGRVNGTFGTTRWVPIHYLYRSFTQEQLVAFYRAADLMLVTPLRDGMNLVAKEFVASRVDEQGVLLLSELAGAAAELGEAVRVNPYDVDGMVEAILKGLAMPAREQQVRMRALRRRVLSADVHQWAADFLEALEGSGQVARGQPMAISSRAERALARRRVAEAGARVLLLDCDGTLVPFSDVPELVRPDEPLRALLRDLCDLPATRVHLVSGRTPEVLEEWFGDLPLGLHAEHGLWSRPGPAEPWQQAGAFPLEWKERARPILESYARRTPGTFIEEKSATLGWHYRMADPTYGAMQAKDLLILLRGSFSNVPVEILSGDKVIEIRPHGVHKGRVVTAALQAAGSGVDLQILAMGDDRTDEDLFAALPPDGIAVHVGPRDSLAPFRLEDVAAARAFLAQLVEEVRHHAEEQERAAQPVHH